MIIIRKPRKRGWRWRMHTNLELAKEYFKMASLVKGNAFEEVFYTKEGMDRLKQLLKLADFSQFGICNYGSSKKVKN